MAHVDAVDESEEVAPASVLDWSTVLAMDGAGRPLLMEMIGSRPAQDSWASRHFRNRCYQPPDG